MKDNKVKLTNRIGTKLLLMSIVPIIIVAVAIGIYSCTMLRKAVSEEVIELLHSTATAVQASFSKLNDEPFSVDASGNMMKGEYNISEHIKDLDAFVEGTHTEITLFYGDVRKATTLTDASGNRIVGTTANAEVTQAVLNGGQVYTSYDTQILGENYFVYYTPLRNPDGAIIGMVFAGQPSRDIDELVSKKITNITAIAVICCIIVAVISLVISSGMTKPLNATVQILEKISAGDLTGNVDRKLLARKDEIGLMGGSLNRLKTELTQIMANIQAAADKVLEDGEKLADISRQSSATADEIGLAINDVSKGAMSQAEDTETATGKISDMGELIEVIVANIDELNKKSIVMRETGEESSAIMNELSDSNDKTATAVYKVAENVKATDNSVNQIEMAVELITNIASQTSLLALNASIEAARAGEAGKGFAVVATEISKLSEESNASAQRISEIIKALAEDSKNSMAMMEEVTGRIKEQQEKLTATKARFDDVISGIEEATRETARINGQAKECDEARQVVVDIIQNLSAISEENAAATQETTASIEELNAMINILAEAADETKGLAQKLDEDTRFFTIE